MNDQRNADEVLKSIFNLIRDAKEELSVNNHLDIKIDDKNLNTIDNPKKNQLDKVQSIEIKKSNDSQNSNWSNINFRSIKFKGNDQKILELEGQNKKDSDFEEILLKTFHSEIENWQKKNLKRIIDEVYNQYTNEKLKKRLK